MGIFTFHYQSRDQYLYTLSFNYTSFINLFIYRCVTRKHFHNFGHNSENFTHSLRLFCLRLKRFLQVKITKSNK
jgi:hypothetical protein